MSWIAEITSVNKAEGVVYATVLYSDGAKNFVETYKNFGTPEEYWIEKTVKAKIVQLDAVESVSIAAGAVDVSKIPIEIVDTRLVEFRQAVSKLRNLIPLIDFGVIPKDDKKITDLISIVQLGYTTYLDGL